MAVSIPKPKIGRIFFMNKGASTSFYFDPSAKILIFLIGEFDWQCAF